MSLKTGQKSEVFHDSIYAMGTRLNVVMMVDDLRHASSVFKHIADEVERLENKLSRFLDNSEVSKINKLAAQQAVQIDTEIFELLELCLKYNKLTHGTFDITVNSFSKKSLIDTIKLNKTGNEVCFEDSDTQIDLGGFGKGYALSKIQSILEESGVNDVLVSFGESSILAKGHHPCGDCWKLGIESVYKAEENVHEFEMRDESLSTSGFIRNSSDAGFHIICPFSFSPVEKMSSITVKSKDPLHAEVLSTALYASLNKAVDFLSNFSDCDIIEVEYSNREVKRIGKYENTK